MLCEIIETSTKRFYVLRWQALPPIRDNSRKKRYWSDIERMLELIGSLYYSPVLGLTRLYCVYKPDPKLYQAVFYIRLGPWYAYYFPWKYVDSFLVEYGRRYCSYVYISVMHQPREDFADRRFRECYERFVWEYNELAFKHSGKGVDLD